MTSQIQLCCICQVHEQLPFEYSRCFGCKNVCSACKSKSNRLVYDVGGRKICHKCIDYCCCMCFCKSPFLIVNPTNELLRFCDICIKKYNEVVERLDNIEHVIPKLDPPTIYQDEKEQTEEPKLDPPTISQDEKEQQEIPPHKFCYACGYKRPSVIHVFCGQCGTKY